MLTLIVVLPLLGFLLNGVLATRLGGNLAGKRFVSVAGCGLPIVSFLLVASTPLSKKPSSGSTTIRVSMWCP